jgi:hypothetical protein
MAKSLNAVLTECGQSAEIACKTSSATGTRVLWAPNGAKCEVAGALNDVVDIVSYNTGYDGVICSFLGFLTIREEGACVKGVSYLNKVITLDSRGEFNNCDASSITSSASTTVTSSESSTGTTSVTTVVRGAYTCFPLHGITYLSVHSAKPCNVQASHLDTLIKVCSADGTNTSKFGLTCNEDSFAEDILQQNNGNCEAVKTALITSVTEYSGDNRFKDAFHCTLGKVLAVQADICEEAVVVLAEVRCTLWSSLITRGR